MTPDPNSRRGLAYQPALDGLRAVAVTGVLLFHAFAASGLPGWFRGGNLGVSVFFTLSGFLIATLLVTEADTTGQVDLARFWGRRALRLAPAAGTTVLGVVVAHRLGLLSVGLDEVAAASWSATNWHIVAAGPDRLLATVLGPLGPTWSLAVEEQAYVVLAAFVWIAARTRRLRLVIGAGAAAAVVTSVAVALTAGGWTPRVEFGTDARAGEIGVGVLLALAVHRRPALLSAHRARLAVLGPVAGCALIALFLFADYSPPWLLRGGFVLVALGSALVVAAAMSDTSVRRLLSVRLLVAVGRASYSLYLVHWPVFLALDSRRTGLDGVALVVVRLAAAAVVATVLHLAVEQPVRRSTLRPAAATAVWLAAAAGVPLVAMVVL